MMKPARSGQQSGGTAIEFVKTDPRSRKKPVVNGIVWLVNSEAVWSSVVTTRMFGCCAEPACCTVAWPLPSSAPVVRTTTAVSAITTIARTIRLRFPTPGASMRRCVTATDPWVRYRRLYSRGETAPLISASSARRIRLRVCGRSSTENFSNRVRS